MTVTSHLSDLVRTGQNEELEKLLKASPSIVSVKTDQGISLLQFAIYCRNSQAVHLLRQYKENLDLFEAASIGDATGIMEILKRDKDLLNSFSADGFTPLGLACFFGHTAIVRELLEMGADPNIASANSFKVAPVHSACATSNLEILELLIRHGANVNVRQMKNITPLHSAAHNGNIKIAALLIKNGADLKAKTKEGKTPLALALESNQKETADLLKFHGRK